MANMTFKEALVYTIKRTRGVTKALDRRVSNLEDEVYKEDAVVEVEGIGRELSVPSNTARYNVINKLGGVVSKDETLTNRAVVKGNTFKWNNLGDLTKYTKYTAYSNVSSVTYNSLMFTQTGSSSYARFELRENENVKFVEGHKYYISFKLNQSNNGRLRIWFGENTTTLIINNELVANTITPINAIGEMTSNKKIYINIFIEMDNTATLTDFILFDLTSASLDSITDTNDARVQKLIEYAKEHPEYDAGSLKSVTFDEVTYCGENILNATGTFSNTNAGVTLIRTNNHIKVSGTATSTDSINIIVNDLYGMAGKDIYPYLDGKPIQILYGNSGTNWNYLTTWITDGTTKVHIPEDATRLLVRTSLTAGVSYNFEANVVFASKPTQSTDTYNGQTITTTQELNGLDTQDELYSYVEGNELVTKKIKRYGKVDLSLLPYQTATNSNANKVYFKSEITNIPNIKYATGSQYLNGISSLYKIETGSIIMSGVYTTNNSLGTSSSEIRIVTDGTSNTTPRGELVYELANPIIEEVSRVPLTCDFTKVENVLVDAETSLEKGVLVYNYAEKVEVVGANIWNEEWEAGTFTDGVPSFSSNTIRSKNYIKVQPNIEYHQVSNFGMLVECYDYNKNYIEGLYVSPNRNFTTPSNCAYIKFRMQDPQYGATYNHDIAIIKGTSGTYTPYFHKEYLESKLAQIKERVESQGYKMANGYINVSSNKFVVERKNVDLGDLTYSRSANNVGTYVFQSYLANGDGEYICNKKYKQTIAYTILRTDEDKLISLSSRESVVRVIDNDYPTKELFKEGMKGIIINFPLAEPVEIDLSDILTEGDMFIETESGGTVTFTSDTDYKISFLKKGGSL